MYSDNPWGENDKRNGKLLMERRGRGVGWGQKEEREKGGVLG